jgi:hypothetical protein
MGPDGLILPVVLHGCILHNEQWWALMLKLLKSSNNLCTAD